MSVMRFVICDDDSMLLSMVDAVISTHGHELVGIADNTMDAVGLVEHGHPDVVVVDPTVGCNTDFDVIDTAIEVGARVIVFSRSAEAPTSGRYSPEPLFVAKPDLPALEQIVDRLQVGDGQAIETDRRHRPVRAASGPPPTGLTDAAAFYSALNDSTTGDALVAISAGGGGPRIDPASLAEIVSETIRTTDRVLVATASVLVLMPGGGHEAIDSLFARTHADESPVAHLEFRSLVMHDGESPADAFDRLKRAPDSIRS